MRKKRGKIYAPIWGNPRQGRNQRQPKHSLIGKKHSIVLRWNPGKCLGREGTGHAGLAAVIGAAIFAITPILAVPTVFTVVVFLTLWWYALSTAEGGGVVVTAGRTTVKIAAPLALNAACPAVSIHAALVVWRALLVALVWVLGCARHDLRVSAIGLLNFGCVVAQAANGGQVGR